MAKPEQLRLEYLLCSSLKPHTKIVPLLLTLVLDHDWWNYPQSARKRLSKLIRDKSPSEISPDRSL